MAGYRDPLGNYGFLMAVVPWVLLIFTFDPLFMSGGGSGGPGQRTAHYYWVLGYLLGTGLVSLVGIGLTIARGSGAIARALVALVVGGCYVLFVMTMLSIAMDPDTRGFE